MKFLAVATSLTFAMACSREAPAPAGQAASPQSAAAVNDAPHDHSGSAPSAVDLSDNDHEGHDHAAPALTGAVETSSPVVTAAALKEPSADSVMVKKKASGGSLADTIADPYQFQNPEVRETYVKAKLVADRLDKMYCYCRCKENEQLAHNSLLTCFQDDHAAHCGICLREAQQAFLDFEDDLPLEVTVKAVDLMYNQGNPAPSMP